MTDLDLDAIEERARAATEGPWSAANEHGDLGPEADAAWCVSRMRPGWEAMSPTEGYCYDIGEVFCDDRDSCPDAEHIAGMDPTTTLTLIARLRQAEADYAAAFDEIASCTLATTKDERDRARDIAARLEAENARLREGVAALAESWRYKGEFGWGPWQIGEGPDREGMVLDDASDRLRALLDEVS